MSDNDNWFAWSEPEPWLNSTDEENQAVLELMPDLLRYLGIAALKGFLAFLLIFTAAFIEFCFIHVWHFVEHLIGGK
jgi:hypothetical protein